MLMEEKNEKRINSADRIGYFLVNFGPAACGGFSAGYRLIFFTNALGISAARIGILSIGFSLFAVICTPFIGLMLDHWGSRRLDHYKTSLRQATALYAIAFSLSWFLPHFAPNTVKMPVILLTQIFMLAMQSMYESASYAVMPVMSTNIKDRITLSSIKGGVSSLAIASVNFAAPLMIQSNRSVQGYMITAAVTTFLALGGAVGTVLIHEQIHLDKPKKKRISFSEIITYIKYKPVFWLCCTQFIQSIGTGTVITLTTYYYSYIVGDLRIYSLVSVIQTIFMLLSLATVGKVIPFIGYKKAYLLGMLGVVWFPFMRIFSVHSRVVLYMTAVFQGIAQGVMVSSKQGLLAEVCDYVMIHKKKQKNATISALFSSSASIAIMIATTVPMLIIGSVGYDGQKEMQIRNTNLAIIIMILVMPAVISTIQAVLFHKYYPIEVEESKRQLRELQKMQEGSV